MSRDGSWVEFLVSYCDIEVEELLVSSRDAPHHTLLVDGCLLLDYNFALCSTLIAKPKQQFAALNRSAVVAQREVLRKLRAEAGNGTTSSSRSDGTTGDPEGTRNPEGTGKLSVKGNVHVRLHNMPPVPEINRNRVPTCEDLGKYLIVNGTVIRSGSTKVLERVQVWRCNTCQGVIETEGKLELRYKSEAPKRCSTETCRGFKFTHQQDDNMTCSDYQEIKIQEKVEQLDMGRLPRSMTVVVEHDLVDTCKAGDDVTIHGIVTQIWDQPVPQIRCSLQTVLHANFIEIHNERRCNLDLTDSAVARHYAHWRRYKDRPMAGRNLILASFCPEVYQLYIVKLAALLVMLGGVTHVDGRGSKVRGECHLLMVGDPGTGKSQILKYVSKLCPRSVITTGIGCTKAGLTVAAVKESGEWALEAGAMVLADGGVCCVDELSRIRETDRVAIHEAMEQQTISVAKAGLVCKLNTRTTVLAATNPRGSYDIEQPISVNVPIGTPLLSRFDLILVLFDDHTETWDSLVSGFLLKDPQTLRDHDILKNYTADTLLSFDELRQYVGHVKGLRPRLTGPAKEILGRYYRRQREQEGRNVSRTTLRMLESLVRLSQAHAKLMMHDVVRLDDAIVTISLVECTMLNSALLGSVSVLHSVFPADPEAEFAKQRSMVLEVLGLAPDFGSSDGAPVRIPPAPKPRPFRDEDPGVRDVPSLLINTQELRKQVGDKAPLVPSSSSSRVLQDQTQLEPINFRQPTTVNKPLARPSHRSERKDKPKQSNFLSRVNQKKSVPISNVTPSSASTTHSSPPKPSSFAQQVREFKARKKARIVPTDPPDCVSSKIEAGADSMLDDMLNQDFSDILSGIADTGTSVASPERRTNGSPQPEISVASAFAAGARDNTPVTEMYDKFSSVRAPGSKVTSECALTNALSFTPFVNTQCVGPTSSAKENVAPPHFLVSPIALVTERLPCDVTPLDNDVTVTPEELARKTTRPDQISSIFHNSSAEKLKKFAYKPRRKQ